MGTLRIVLLSAFVVVEQVEARFEYLAQHWSTGADQIEVHLSLYRLNARMDFMSEQNSICRQAEVLVHIVGSSVGRSAFPILGV